MKIRDTRGKEWTTKAQKQLREKLTGTGALYSIKADNGSTLELKWIRSDKLEYYAELIRTEGYGE